MHWSEKYALKELHGLTDEEIDRVRVRAARIERNWQPDGAREYIPFNLRYAEARAGFRSKILESLGA